MICVYNIYKYGLRFIYSFTPSDKSEPVQHFSTKSGIQCRTSPSNLASISWWNMILGDLFPLKKEASLRRFLQEMPWIQVGEISYIYRYIATRCTCCLGFWNVFLKIKNFPSKKNATIFGASWDHFFEVIGMATLMDIQFSPQFPGSKMFSSFFMSLIFLTEFRCNLNENCKPPSKRNSFGMALKFLEVFWILCIYKLYAPSCWGVSLWSVPLGS